MTSESVGDTLAIRDRVGFEADDLFDSAVAEPRVQHLQRLGVVLRRPCASWGERAEFDVWMQERAHRLEVLAGERVCEGLANRVPLARIASCSKGRGRMAFPVGVGWASS